MYLSFIFNMKIICIIENLMFAEISIFKILVDLKRFNT